MVRWRKNLYILMAAQFFVMAAMTMIVPFLPLYLQELGVTDPGQISIWSGVIFGVNFLTAFLFAPLWGKIADRQGRKLMVLRSGFGMAIVMVLMGFATGPWSLFFLRMLNGTISGFIPASIALVSTNTPKEYAGRALGMLQSGTVAGTICGPLIGGLLADAFGFRAIFNITGLGIAVAAVAVLFLVKEDFEKPEQAEKTKTSDDFKRIAGVQPMIPLYTVIFLVQFALIGVNPLISVFVGELSGREENAFYAGLAVASLGVANMLASPKLGKLSDTKGAQYVLFGSLIGAVLLSIPQAFVTNLWQLIAARFFVGLCLGGLLPAANTLIRQLSPQGMESRAYGFSNSFLFLGNMLGPAAGGLVSAALGMRGLFLISAAILGAAVFVMYKKVIPKLAQRTES
ncbi:MFS transporter [uncultured Marinococcus sp.]|uniref:MFS transporter n=1 Tax=uncultured Marinococcus sp. TaxID=487012 RepID=UPI00260FAFFC|nr:MFS transporter [uncultured Marinococcus sp.]